MQLAATSMRSFGRKFSAGLGSAAPMVWRFFAIICSNRSFTFWKQFSRIRSTEIFPATLVAIVEPDKYPDRNGSRMDRLRHEFLKASHLLFRTARNKIVVAGTNTLMPKARLPAVLLSLVMAAK